MELFPNQDRLVVSVIFTNLLFVQKHLSNRFYAGFKGSSWHYREGDFSFDDCFKGYPPHGATHKKQVLVFSPKPQEFALFTANCEDGWNSLSYRLTEQGKCSALVLEFSSDKTEFPARSFTLIENGNDIRHVSARMEDKWLFYERGIPLPQEDTSPYANRLIKDRLTNDQLIALAKRFGVNLDNPDPLMARGMLFCQTK